MNKKNIVKNEYASDSLQSAIMQKLNAVYNKNETAFVSDFCKYDLVVDDKQINALAKKYTKAKLAEHLILNEREVEALMRLITELTLEFEYYKAEAKQVESNLRAELFDLHNEFDAYVIEAEADADDKRFSTTSC